MTGVDDQFRISLAWMREELGMSQTELANRLSSSGIPFHQTTLSRIENGERPVRLGEAYAIADILGVSMPEMLDGHITEATRPAWRPVMLTESQVKSIVYILKGSTE